MSYNLYSLLPISGSGLQFQKKYLICCRHWEPRSAVSTFIEFSKVIHIHYSYGSGLQISVVQHLVACLDLNSFSPFREINFVDETVRTLAGNGTKGSDYKGGGQGTNQACFWPEISSNILESYWTQNLITSNWHGAHFIAALLCLVYPELPFCLSGARMLVGDYTHCTIQFYHSVDPHIMQKILSYHIFHW
jgi:hypothetical protein